MKNTEYDWPRLPTPRSPTSHPNHRLSLGSPKDGLPVMEGTMLCWSSWLIYIYDGQSYFNGVVKSMSSDQRGHPPPTFGSCFVDKSRALNAKWLKHGFAASGESLLQRGILHGDEASRTRSAKLVCPIAPTLLLINIRAIVIPDRTSSGTSRAGMHGGSPNPSDWGLDYPADRGRRVDESATSTLFGLHR